MEAQQKLEEKKENTAQFNVKIKDKKEYAGNGYVFHGKYGKYISVKLDPKIGDIPAGSNLFLYVRKDAGKIFND